MLDVFDTVQLHFLSAKNRIVRSATWEAIAKPDGTPSEGQIKIYTDLAQGEVGTIITGFTSVRDDDVSLGPGMVRLSRDEQIFEWKRLIDSVHESGAVVIVQLALGTYFRDGRVLEPDDVSLEDITGLIDDFRQAARRAKAAGFDGIQIHGAHNFWLSRFVSPAFNHRTDAYGGSQENRSRLLLDIYQAVRAAAPGLHITLKMNCSDFRRGGLMPSDALVTCRLMAEAGLDSIEISGNGTSVSGIKAGHDEAYFLPFARELRKERAIPIILVGGMRSLEVMNDLVRNEEMDMISLSRPLICEPNLVRRWHEGRTAPARCISCNRCYGTPGHRCFF